MAAQLIGEDRLARSRWALDDVDAADEQAALDDRIEPWDPGRDPWCLARCHGHPFRGRTTDTAVPWPSSLSTSTAPPMARHSSATTHSPMPNPVLRPTLRARS